VPVPSARSPALAAAVLSEAVRIFPHASIHRSATDRATLYHELMQRVPSEQSDLGRFEEPAVLVLTSLAERPRHGYAIVKDVETIAGISLGTGTLYATLARLEARGLIEGMPSDDRRRPYRITGAGLVLLRDRLERMEAILRTGLQRLALG
jgi:DNA-binding PadR family transcriptional regulator